MRPINFCRSAAHGTSYQLHVMLMRCHINKGTTSSLCANIRAERVQPGTRVLKLQRHQRSRSLNTHTHTHMAWQTLRQIHKCITVKNLEGISERETTLWATFLWNSSVQSGGSSRETSVFCENALKPQRLYEGKYVGMSKKFSNQPPCSIRCYMYTWRLDPRGGKMDWLVRKIGCS